MTTETVRALGAIALAIAIPAVALAQAVPTTINYQGRLTDNSPQQNPIDGTVWMRFTIYDAQTGGVNLWQEPAAGGIGVTVVKGIFNYVLGSTVPLPASIFSGTTSVRYLQITVNPGAGEEILTPRQLLTSTPYTGRASTTISADDAGKLGGVAPSGYVQTAGSYADPAWLTSLAGSKITGIVGNANLLDGIDSTSFSLVGHVHSGADITSGTVDETRLDGLWTTKGFTAVTLATTNTSASSLNVGGGINAGTGNVGIVGADGRIPAITSTYFANLNGSALTNIGAASTSTTAGVLGRPGFTISTVDTVSIQYTSIAIGTDGLALISYNDATNLNLKVAHCSDATCSAATLSTLESVGDVGKYTSITIGADGLGVISYYYANAGDLKVAHCSDVACSTATLTTVDSTGNVGQYTSITIGTDGLPLISYYDVTNTALKVAHCNDAACSTATLSTLDSTGTVGQYTSITINSMSRPLISYYDATNTDLKVAECNNGSCTVATLNVLVDPDDIGKYSSIAIGSDGMALISYYKTIGVAAAQMLAHCSNTACGSMTTQALWSSADDGTSSIAVGPDGRGLISHSANATFVVSHCTSDACSLNTLATLDPGFVGAYNSIAIGTDGLGLISYRDGSTGALKVIHLSNALGTPYVRRR